MPDEGFSISVDTSELEAELLALPRRLYKQTLRTAFQEAGDTILEPMKALCPEKTEGATDSQGNSLAPGVLKESLTTQVQIGKIRAPRVKVGTPIETNQVGWLIENGFDNLKSRTHIAGKHFIASAFDESAERAVNVFSETLVEILEGTD